MSEKLCLQWNDFHDNIKTAFANLGEDNDFADVTLACEDGQQIEAHKMILAASSRFFQRLLQRNKHAHPLIYMRGMKSADLLAIVDFLYRGEANVCQENLDSFLAIAEELQLKGLMGNTDANVENTNADQKYVPPKNMHPDRSINIPKQIYVHETPSQKLSEDDSDRTVAVSSHFSGNMEELQKRVMSMMEKSENYLPKQGRERADMCKVCGKEGERTQIRDHIEANHLEGIVVPCNHCEKSFRSRSALRMHKKRQHILD